MSTSTKTPVLGMVTPEEWVSRTKVMIGRRSQSMLKVDAAYEQYYKLRSEENAKNLHTVLEAYLKEKGGNWAKVDRNKNSNGLMQSIFDLTGPKKTQDVLEKRIPESRHGVIYLWGNTVVYTQWAKFFLEGAFNLVSAYSGDNTPILNIPQNDIVGNVADLATTPLGWLKQDSTGKKVSLQPAVARQSSVATLEDLPSESILVKIKQTLGKMFEKIYDLIKNGVRTIYEKIKMNYDRVQDIAWNVLQKLILYVLQQVCASIVPFVGAAFDLFSALKDSIEGISARVTAAYHRSKFIVMPGHPQMIADGIEKQMNWAIGKGLFGVLKSGAKIGAAVMSVGASTIGDILASAFEFVIKFVLRYFEGSQMRMFVDIARKHLEIKRKGPDGVERPAIAYDTTRFNHLFSFGCDASPCVPMLTLNSGITGDQMMFMKMFDDTDAHNVVDQETFNHATEYFNLLKGTGRDYLRDSGFQFTSQKNDVRGYLWHAVTHHQYA